MTTKQDRIEALFNAIAGHPDWPAVDRDWLIGEIFALKINAPSPSGLSEIATKPSTTTEYALRGSDGSIFPCNDLAHAEGMNRSLSIVLPPRPREIVTRQVTEWA